MTEKLCGICHEKTHKEFCWHCQERENRMNRAVAKKMLAMQHKRNQKKKFEVKESLKWLRQK